MRISEQQVADLRNFEVNSAYDQLIQAQTTLSSGRQINAPSDNPAGTGTALSLQDELAQNTAFTSTANDTESWMQTTTNALNGVNDALLAVRTLGVQGANGTLTADERTALANQVGQLIQQGAQSANATYNGQYVLSGQKTLTVPFTTATSGGLTTVAYQGDSVPISRELSSGLVSQVSIPGSNALPAVFGAMSQLQADLLGGDSATISGDLATIDKAQGGLLLAQTTAGAITNRVTAVQGSLQSQHTTLTAQWSGIVDANFAQASVTFNQRLATYQASLTAAGKVVQSSLMDFLK
ncbi:MAG TPA: flagellar hook-associated protein FlgL [Chloroflexota bacterium]|jgi:flagellar hook-associated protein 3 FlgL